MGAGQGNLGVQPICATEPVETKHEAGQNYILLREDRANWIPVSIATYWAHFAIKYAMFAACLSAAVWVGKAMAMAWQLQKLTRNAGSPDGYNRERIWRCPASLRCWSRPPRVRRDPFLRKRKAPRIAGLCWISSIAICAINHPF